MIVQRRVEGWIEDSRGPDSSRTSSGLLYLGRFRKCIRASTTHIQRRRESAPHTFPPRGIHNVVQAISSHSSAKLITIHTPNTAPSTLENHPSTSCTHPPTLLPSLLLDDTLRPIQASYRSPSCFSHIITQTCLNAASTARIPDNVYVHALLYTLCAPHLQTRLPSWQRFDNLPRVQE